MASEAKFRTVLPNNTISAAVDYTGESTIYQSKLNTMGQAEMVFDSNDIEFSLTPAQFGTRSTVYLPPSYKLIKNVFIEVELNGRVDVNAAGLQLIQEWGYRVPGCERMFFPGEAMLFDPLLQCENTDKRVKYLELTGLANYTKMTGTTPADGVAVDSTNATAETGGIYTLPVKRKVYALFNMPWCSLDGNKQPKPYPLHLTTQPLEIDVLFRDRASVSSDTSLTIVGARIIFTYETLANMNLYKNTVYKYNFSAPYHIAYGAKKVDTSDSKVHLDLSGIRNGEITELRLLVRKVGTYAEERRNRYKGVKLSEVELTYAGQRIWKAVGDSSQLYDLTYNRLPYEVPWGYRRKSKVLKRALSASTTSWSNVLEPNMTYSYESTSGSIDSFIDTYEDLIYLYVIPVANVLENMKNPGDYNLGADFKDSDLKLIFKPPATLWDSTVDDFIVDPNAQWQVLMEYRLTSIYQFDGQSAKLIQ